jgi:HEAT repeat protein
MKKTALLLLVMLISGAANPETFTERLFSADPSISLQAQNEIKGFTDASKAQLNGVLLQVFNSKNKLYRRIAITSAAKAGVYSQETVNALLQALKTDPDSLCRLNAAEALSNLKLKDDENVRSTLLSVMADRKEDKGVRQTAAQSLLKLDAGKEEVLRFFSDALKDESPEIRAWSATAASEKEALLDGLAGEIVNALNDPDRIVRCNAALALGKLKKKDERTVAALKKALSDPDKDVAGAAKKALETDKK